MNDYLAIFAPVLVWYGLSIVSGWLAGRLGASPLEWFLIPFLSLPLIAAVASLLAFYRRGKSREREFRSLDEDSKAE